MTVNISLVLGCLFIFGVAANQTDIKNDNENPFLRTGFWINSVNNNKQCTWKAGQNFKPTLPPHYVKALLGTLSMRNTSQYNIKYHSQLLLKNISLPEFFDARSTWPLCKSVTLIRDQGECGSCWAVAAASVFGDRLCISSKGIRNLLISAEEPLACCKNCGNGCYGGYVEEVWRFFQKHGVVTGGEYRSHEGCLPYSKEPCDHTSDLRNELRKCDLFDQMVTPRCEKRCSNSLYNITFSKDHRRVGTTFALPPDPETIQMELYKNGPLQCIFEVYEDFLSYKSGVYKPTELRENVRLGLHSVKLIGWGIDSDSNTPYWLAMNSWNPHWGDSGTFKIERGHNICNFESNIFGCTIKK